VAGALLRPGWRARWDDLTGGWGISPVGAALAAGALAVVVAVALGPWWGAGGGSSATASLPMVEPSGAPSGTALPIGGAPVPASGTVEGASGPTAGAAAEAGPIGGGASEGGAADARVVVVHASGAVAAPGVHRLPAGARVGDLVAVAGGATVDADLDRVNLAAPLVDGTRVHVPRHGEAPSPDGATSAPGAGSAPNGVGRADGAPVGPISLSSASQTELESLPGVGPATATAIIEHRRQAGGFTTVDQLLDVRGIGEARLEQLRPLVVP
jgi:competence protein ComEA